jgi:riboflavin kinase/FMN adenylyltransferase
MQSAANLVISGVVQRGRQLGRRLGFPTANVAADTVPPSWFGVYAVRARLADGRRVSGVASLGLNPTVAIPSPRLEVWIFDFDEDIYDQPLETELIARLREERRFPDLDALIAQVRRDAEAARALLAARVAQDA